MSTEPGRADITQFKDDDEAYLKWLEAHPNGFVVNSHRSPKASYLKLHRTSCGYLRTEERSNWTTGDYIKTCSDSALVLESWAIKAADGVLDPCPNCKPY